jgi:spectinomycin phosphotransferase
MLEKPDIEDDLIITCLRDSYGLSVAELSFLPIGYDLASSVYRVLAEDQTTYFLKLRSGKLQEASVAIPRFLNDQGIHQVIAPIPTKAHTLWNSVGEFNLILYPFIESRTGMEIGLSGNQWVEFGVALRAIHATKLPAELLAHVQREAYDPSWRELVRQLDAQIMSSTYDNPFEAELAAFWRLKHQDITRIVDRAEQLGRIVQQKPL